MKQKLLLILIGSAIVAVMALTASAAAQSRTPPKSEQFVGQKRPDFKLPDMSGTYHDASDWDDQVMVVNFWATWCAPCKREIPVFNQLQEEYETAGVRFIGIALDDKKAVERFEKIIPIDYTVLIADTDGIALAQRYGNVIGVLPYTVFVDRDGRIAEIAAGGLNDKITREAIEKLL